MAMMLPFFLAHSIATTLSEFITALEKTGSWMDLTDGGSGCCQEAPYQLVQIHCPPLQPLHPKQGSGHEQDGLRIGLKACLLNVQPPGSEASSPDWAQLLAVQMVAMEQQKKDIGEICLLVLILVQVVNHLATSPEQQATPPVTPPVPEWIKCLIATPEMYGGDPEGCDGFVIQWESLWALLAMHKARNLIQADYDMEFWTLAAGTHWNKSALVDTFVNGIRVALQAELAFKQEATSLNEVVHLAIIYDNLLLERRRQFPRRRQHTVARPLIDLLRGTSKRLRWGPKAERSFSELKEAFSTASVLQQPDPEKPFVVEVDASDGRGLPTAWEMVDQLFHHVFQQFRLLEDIISDRGPQFTSRVWRELLDKINIMVSLTSAYHPQANGQVERVNHELGKFLRLYCQRHTETWSTYLPWEDMPRIHCSMQ
ncbi:hypothetical protein P4O66_004186 [Electrophorus voltai]|uniref:Integrase catalytic domain-containing protein n=1 Tax=Electrophorus voltai TaxID=2609070 RepID=A0AAD8ZP58_9TELE|nr:hypothetical protein P4O66_004186 [Electrophorus voltai]